MRFWKYTDMLCVCLQTSAVSQSRQACALGVRHAGTTILRPASVSRSCTVAVVAMATTSGARVSVRHAVLVSEGGKVMGKVTEG